MSDNNFNDSFKSIKDSVIKFLDPEYHERQQAEQKEGIKNNDSEFGFNEKVGKKVQQIIDDFIEAAPLIEEAGYKIRDMEVELSVIPKLIPHFLKVSETSELRRMEILEQVSDKRLIKLLLQALYKADNFQQSLKMGNLEFTGIEIEVTAIPAVRLLYKNMQLKQEVGKELLK